MSVPDRGSTIVGTCVALIVFSTLAVALRFLSRRLSKAGFWYDDWLALAALPIAIAANITIFVDVHNGYGKHQVDDTFENVVSFLRLLYWDEILFTICVTLSKLSVLFFYSRTFAINRTVRLSLWSLGGVTVAWCISILFSIIFQCSPIRRAWNPTVPGKCINLYAFFIGQGVPNVLIDFVLLLLPLPFLLRLHVRLPQKVALIGVFMLGYLVIAISIARLVTYVNIGKSKVHTDITWTYVDPGLWTTAEMSVSVIGASIPSIFYLVKRGISVLFPNQPSSSKRSSDPSNTFLSNRRNQTAKVDENGEFSRLKDRGSKPSTRKMPPGTSQLTSSCVAGKERDLELGDRPSYDEEAVLPRSQIHVRNDLDVSYDDLKRAPT